MDYDYKSDKDEHRLAGEGILIGVGCRLYELFCIKCNRVLMEEDSHFMRVQCQTCKQIYAYRADPGKEKAIFEFSQAKATIQ